MGNGLKDHATAIENEELLDRPGGLDAELQLSLDCFSGGELRRLGLLRAWLLDQPIEVLDEPTSSLDSVAAGRVRRILQERARQRTVLVATHDQGLIAGCDAVIDLTPGAPLELVEQERTA